MGTNNLTTKNPGDIISNEDPNQYKTSLTGDVVPRNSSGIPTDIFGSIGSTFYRWLHGYFKILNIGEVASDLSIEESSGAMSFKVGGVQKSKIDSNGFDGSFIKQDSIPKRKMVALAKVASAASTHSTTSTSFQDGASVSITTTGRPVFVGLIPNPAGGFGNLGVADTGTSIATVQFLCRIQRDGTQIAATSMTVATNSSGTTLEMYTPVGGVWTIDDADGAGLAAGTYTYKLQLAAGFNNMQASVGSYKLVAWEL